MLKTQIEDAPILAAAPKKEENHLAWVEALRGFAAMWVIIYHSREQLWVGFYQIHKTPDAYSFSDRLFAWLSLPSACGASAVMLFFLISGFCIHLPYAANARVLQPAQYSVRRLLRIFPPYLCAVALTCAVEWMIYWINGDAPSPWHRVLRVALLSQNYGHSGQLWSNGALWSLPVEVELYFAYLLFYFLLSKASWKWAMTIVSISSLAATFGYIHGIGMFEANFIRFWAMWCAGAFLAEKYKSGRLPEFKVWNALIFFVLLIGAVCGVGGKWHIAIEQYLWAGAYYHVLWIALLYPNSIHKFPAWCVRLFVWLGTISYSAYLIHKALFALAAALWVNFAGVKPASFAVPLLFSISIWPVAWLFWKFCEYPFHNLSRRAANFKFGRPSVQAALFSPRA
jgi:peptidoglycan/LPS O-acetylase OafA/YrhL